MKDLLETRLELLKTNLFLIDMIDRWSEEDSKRYDELSKEISLLGVLNNEASIDNNKKIGDSIDLAFLVLGKKEKVDISNIKIIDNIPYESENKYSAVFYEKDGETYCTVKGSLEKVNSFCSSINLKNDTDLDEQNESLASRGYRVIALANGKVEKKENKKAVKISKKQRKVEDAE